MFDAHAWLVQELTGEDAPDLVVVIDVKAYYSSITHMVKGDIPCLSKSVLLVPCQYHFSIEHRQRQPGHSYQPRHAPRSEKDLKNY